MAHNMRRATQTAGATLTVGAAHGARSDAEGATAARHLGVHEVLCEARALCTDDGADGRRHLADKVVVREIVARAVAIEHRDAQRLHLLEAVVDDQLLRKAATARSTTARVCRPRHSQGGGGGAPAHSHRTAHRAALTQG
jgi:hypothetical protein